MTLPTGTVTFLFTDIEASTRLWEAHPEAMRLAMARHDEIAGDVIDRHGGALVKARGEGDSLFAVFALATDAAAAALALQTALTHEAWPMSPPLRARMALHTGEAGLRDGDYYGPEVNRCARLRAVGHGGQILLSVSTQSLCQDALPPGCSLRPLGEHRLKDLGRPEGVSQLCHTGLPSEFPPLNSLDNPDRPNNLPLQLTSFVGRDKEVSEVRSLVGKTRLVTLTGTGGCGKTRLALQVAAELLEDHPNGVWLVELAALTDPALVPATVASSLRIAEQPGLTVEQTLTGSLKPKDTLIILDNCEHVIDSSAQLVTTLLKDCPRLTVLATSREHLNIRGEQAYRVPSLETPERERPGLDLLDFSAVRLFLDRAQASDARFEVTEQNAATISQICRRLDGIPLAIELAAARVRAVPVAEIASRLDDRFALLTRGDRTALPRQQTLRALVDWSWALLNPQEQALLRRVSVFVDGFTLDAAETVCGDGEARKELSDLIDPYDVLDLIAQLVDKSLVMPDSRSEALRYRLLETVRQYGLGRLRLAGEEELLNERHFQWVYGLALEAEPGLDGPGMQRWLDRLELELGNIRAAFSHGQAGEPGEQMLRMAVALFRFWFVRGYLTEGRDVHASALSDARKCDPVVRANALNNVGMLAWRQGDFAAAEPWTLESLELWRTAGQRFGEAAALNNLGMLLDDRGDHAAARSRYEAAAAIYREIGDRARLGKALANLGTSLQDTGDLDAAETAFSEFLTLAKETGDPWCTATAYHNLGEIALQRDDLAEAAAQLRRALPAMIDIGDTPQALQVLLACGRLGIAGGEWELSTCLLAAVETIQRTERIFLRDADLRELEEATSRARGLTSAEDFAAAWDRGAALDLTSAVQLALSGRTSASGGR